MIKEPSKKFFKLFLLLFVINILFSVVVYFISPEQVPSKLTNQGFEDYRSKSYNLFFPIILQLMFLFVALFSYKTAPLMVKLYPQSFQNWYIKLSGLVLGRSFERTDINKVISKFISVLILSMSTLLISFHLISLGFAFKVSNLATLLLLYMFLVLIVGIFLLRFFSKRL